MNSGHAHAFVPRPYFRRPLWHRILGSLPRVATALAPVLVVSGVIALTWGMLLYLPPRVISSQGLTATDRLNAEGGLRSLLLQGAVGIALLIGLYFTARSSNLAGQGQYSDRFSKAVEQLGHANIDVRIGGLYALEHIAKDSRRFRPAIVEVLQRFISGHSRITTNAKMIARIGADVQVAVSIIARRRGSRQEGTSIDMYGLSLSGIRVSKGKLAHLNAFYAKLPGASFVHSDLR